MYADTDLRNIFNKGIYSKLEYTSRFNSHSSRLQKINNNKSIIICPYFEKDIFSILHYKIIIEHYRKNR